MLIECQNLSLGYEGRGVIRNLDLSVEQGDYLCIAGENGSGKSTVLKGIAGLLAPLEGRLFRSPELNRGLGYLAQEGAGWKDFPAGAWEVALSGNLGGLRWRPCYRREEKRRTAELMERLGIGGLRDRCFRELSGGERRRVLLARTLCAGRRLLALDEPAAGLDGEAAASLYRLLAELNREEGIAIVMVSHDAEGMKREAGRILRLEGGNPRH